MGLATTAFTGEVSSVTSLKGLGAKDIQTRGRIKDWLANWIKDRINAIAPEDMRSNQLEWRVGQLVSGLYLGHRFKGQVKSASSTSSGLWMLTLVFDEAVDVVASEHFFNYRRQVNCTVGPDRRTARKTSDGQPQIVMDT